MGIYCALFSYIGFEQMNLSQILKGEEEKEEDFEKKDSEKGRNPKEGSFSVYMAQIFRHFCGSRRYRQFLIVGIQKIAQPQSECYAVIDGKVYTDQDSFTTSPGCPGRWFRQIPTIDSVP